MTKFEARIDARITTGFEEMKLFMVQLLNEEMSSLGRGYLNTPGSSARTSTVGAAQGVCTFVREGLTLIKLDPFLHYDTALELCPVEAVIGRKKQESVFLVNAYSNPQLRDQRLGTLFYEARWKAVDASVLVAGNFNSSHKNLGYPRTTTKGRSLLEEAEEVEFELLSDPQQPSRIGPSITRDTTSDLVFADLLDDRPVSWRNQQEITHTIEDLE
ncbi:hypothetical protein HPB51_015476 [Rhipicephalus microplus]|uniref:Endonuclease/exonuclease/phosphatase domain-containing protein n=1 Tax=Rhipicephalus microplus TaxID=6941 RepID=A0A9J6EI32_RHIMP|nr:hypothetical protein HPB51_015476 [Rhipicephalus microplus]